MRFASADVGSNTTLLLIMEKGSESFQVLCDEIYFTRLGEGMGETGDFSPSALIRMDKAFEDIKKRLKKWEASSAVVAAFSAARRARNPQPLKDLARKWRLPPVQIISPLREAQLAFAGSLFGLGGDLKNPLVVDIGGGSTEIASLNESFSLNLGSVSLAERFLSGAALNSFDKAGALSFIRRALAPVRDFLKGPFDGVAASAGTPVSLGFMEWETEDANHIHGKPFSAARLEEWFEKLASLSLEERKKLPYLPRHRADVIVFGTAILKEILALRGAKSFIVSATGVRHGLVLELFQKSGLPPPLKGAGAPSHQRQN